MTRGVRNPIKAEQISVRLPVEVLHRLDEMKEKEGTDRSAIIARAVKYWVSVDGNITTDAEYLTRLDEIEKRMDGMMEVIQKLLDYREMESKEQRAMLAEQQKMTLALLKMREREE